MGVQSGSFLLVLKMKLMMMSTYLIFMTEQITLLTKQQTTNVTRTRSGRIVKRLRNDDYVI